MQLFAKKSSYKKEPKMSDYSLFSETMSRYAQEVGATTPEGNQDLDPNTLQVGQMIYDQDGVAHTVIQNENGNITTMPADQAGQQIPQNVKNVDQNELGNYSQNPPQQNVQAKVAQEEFGIDWEELESMALEVATFAQMGKEKAFFDALDRLNTTALSYVQMPTDLSPKDMTARKAQEEPSYLRIVEQGLLSSFSEALDDIETQANYREPGYLETTAQALLDSVQNNLLVNNITNLEAMVQDKFNSFLSELEAYASSGETPPDEHNQKLLQFYESYFS